MGCNEKFSEFNELRKHKKVHSDKLFKCSQCEEKFSDFGAFMKHKKLGTCETDSPNESVNVNVYALKEQEKRHTNEEPFKCNDCDEIFENEKGLMDHENRHVEKPFKCDMCDKNYKTENDLKEHKTSHSTEKEKAKKPNGL